MTLYNYCLVSIEVELCQRLDDITIQLAQLRIGYKETYLHQIFEIIVLLLSYSAIGDRKEGSTVHVVGFNTCFIGWLI